MRIARAEGGGLTPYANHPDFVWRDKFMADNPDDPQAREIATSMTADAVRRLYEQYERDQQASEYMAERGYYPQPQNDQGSISARTPTISDDVRSVLPTETSKRVFDQGVMPAAQGVDFLTGAGTFADAHYRFARTGETPSAADRASLAVDMAPGIIAAAAVPVWKGVKAAAAAIDPRLAGAGAGTAGLTMSAEEAEAGKLNMFSRMAQAVDNIPMEKMTSEQALAALSKGVSASELRWSGMLDYLKANPKVNKAALQEFASKNAIIPEETVIGEGIHNRARVVPRQEIRDRHAPELARLRKEAYDWGRSSEPGWREKQHQAQSQIYELERKMVDEEIEAMGGLAPGPQYDAWSTPGADFPAYREHVFTVPGNDYVSPHYNGMWKRLNQKPIPGYIAHMRSNQFPSPEGRIYVMEELQSDLAQDLRKEGPLDISKADIYQQEGGTWAADFNGQMIGGFGSPEDVRKALKKFERKPTPYTDNTEDWTDLGIKRALQAAQESGSKFFAWPPGAVQSSRYDLSQSLRELSYQVDPDTGTYRVWGKLPDGEHWNVMENASEDEVRRTVGDTIFKRMKDGEGRNPVSNVMQGTLSGTELTVGGEGMTKYYDQIVPKRVAEVIRKATGQKVKVQKIKVPTGHGEMEYWGIPMTDEIKAAKWSSFSTGGGVVERALALTAED
jgi:hypothetical protein